jgi:NADH dehydrogenase
MSAVDGTDLVTGAFSHIGSHIARLLLDQGRAVRTLTHHVDRPHELRQRGVEVHRYSFEDPDRLVRSLQGIETLYNTYWVRIEHDRTTFGQAVADSSKLFDAAHRAGVRRIVHVSVSNASIGSTLPYYHGKAQVEQALKDCGVPYASVRPTWVFGSDREVLANNIAYLLRKLPVFGVPGDGAYRVQPVHVDDVARICVDQAGRRGNAIIDAAGPETLTFRQSVERIREAVGSRARIVGVPVTAMLAASRLLGRFMHDVVLTREEVDGLMQELLVCDGEPLGRVGFSAWLSEHGATLGLEYANELGRHFELPAG